MVVVDSDIGVRGDFEAMCKFFQITFWSLARVNHKGNSVEKYHRFLNKTQAISGQDCGNNDVFIQNKKPYYYEWNRAPVDDTGVMRSIAAVGREFRSPHDTELLPKNVTIHISTVIYASP